MPVMMMMMMMILMMMKSIVYAKGYARCIQVKRLVNDKVQGANSTFSLNENTDSASRLCC